MKFLKAVFLLFFLTISCAASPARAYDTLGPLSGPVETRMRQVLEECLVRPYGLRSDGSEVWGDYRSRCSGVVREGQSAFLSLESPRVLGRAWELKLLGSEQSDGGDVWDVAVWDDHFHLVLEAQRVLAFGDPFEALTILTGAQVRGRVYDAALDVTSEAASL